MCSITPQTCELLVTSESGHLVRLVLSDGRSSPIADKGLVRLDEMPARWFCVGGLERLAGGQATLAEVRAFVSEIIPCLFVLSGCLPLVWQSSRRHARFYERLLGKQYNFRFVAGTLSGGSAISDWTSLTGGSDDEQILMLSVQ